MQTYWSGWCNQLNKQDLCSSATGLLLTTRVVSSCDWFTCCNYLISWSSEPTAVCVLQAVGHSSAHKLEIVDRVMEVFAFSAISNVVTADSISRYPLSAEDLSANPTDKYCVTASRSLATSAHFAETCFHYPSSMTSSSTSTTSMMVLMLMLPLSVLMTLMTKKRWINVTDTFRRLRGKEKLYHQKLISRFVFPLWRGGGSWRLPGNTDLSITLQRNNNNNNGRTFSLWCFPSAFPILECDKIQL